jgi:lipoic acid synthetase
MVGLGETMEEIHSTLRDLKNSGVSIVYIGQYLSPTKAHWPVKKYYTPKEFASLETIAKNMGFKAVRSGPLVRSSYRAFESFTEYLG